MRRHRACTGNSDFVWFNVRKEDGPAGRGVGFYFRQAEDYFPTWATYSNHSQVAPPAKTAQRQTEEVGLF